MAEPQEEEWMQAQPLDTWLEFLRDGVGGLAPEGSGALPDISDPELAAYTAMSTNPQKRAALERQLVMAEQLQNQGLENHSSGLGAALGGLGNIINRGMGAYQRKKAETGLSALASEEGAARARYGRGARTWDPQQAANLGILSGDPMLGAYGQAQQKAVQNMDAGSLRALGLNQAKRRLALQEQEAARKAATGKEKFDTDKWKAQQTIAGLWKGLGLREEELNAKLAEQEARRADKKGESSVYGLEIAPGATPTPDDAKIVKGIRAAATTMKSFTSDFYNLYRKDGGKLTGPNGTTMKQLLTSIQLEAKDVAGLGALSGPDQGLMEKLAGSNPTTIVGILRDEFGVDDVGAAVQQLERWVDTKVNAKVKEYGYRAPTAGSPRSPPDTNLTLPPGASPAGGAAPQRVRAKDGTIYERQPNGDYQPVK
jgi:hypothetical protein